MRVLVADDDPVARRLLSVHVQGLGHTLVTASDGDEALRLLLEDGPFDVMLADWAMPGIDGLTLCRKVREAGLATRCVVVTAIDVLDRVHVAREAGAELLLTKPYRKEELVRALSDLGSLGRTA